MMARNRFKQTLRVVRATDCATGACVFFLQNTILSLLISTRIGSFNLFFSPFLFRLFVANPWFNLLCLHS